MPPLGAHRLGRQQNVRCAFANTATKFALPNNRMRTAHVPDNEKSHPAPVPSQAMAFSIAPRTIGSWSLPKYISVLFTKIVGEPNPPRSITSWVLARKRCLISSSSDRRTRAAPSKPQASAIWARTSGSSRFLFSPK